MNANLPAGWTRLRPEALLAGESDAYRHDATGCVVAQCAGTRWRGYRTDERPVDGEIYATAAAAAAAVERHLSERGAA